jgi:S-DNA-T family DNA segregation ATPase FtsK/SpoIIIE
MGLIRFNVVEGLSLTDMQKQKEAIENYIGKKINITYNNKNFFIEVFEKTLQSSYNFTIPEVEKLKGISFPVGYSLDKIEWLEISEDNPHLLIAGMSGSGKSVFLRAVITSIILLANKYSSGVKLHLVDFKYGAEFNVFRKSKYVASFSRDTEECLKMLREVDKTISERYKMFANSDVVNISEYNKIHRDKMEYELVIIDEFSSLIDRKDREAKDLLITISQKARAAGLFLIIATQRPDYQVIDGKIKANFTNIVGLKCLNETNSEIIWDTKGLEDLKGKGHCLIRKGDGEEIEVQGMYLSTEQARDLIKHTYKENKKPKAKGKPISKVEIEELKNKKETKSNITNFKFLEVLDEKKQRAG